MGVREAVLIAPKYDVDKVLHTATLTMTKSDAASSTDSKAFSPSETGFNNDTFVIGIYSVDGGDTWNDAGIYDSNSNVSASPNVSLTLESYSDGSLLAIVSQTSVFNGGVAYNILIKVAFLWRIGLPDIPDSTLTYDSNKAYKSSDQYMKIFADNLYEVSTNNSNTITHNLGYKPMVRVFVRDNVGTPSAKLRPLSQIINNLTPANQDQFISVGLNTVTIQLGNFITYPATVYYRIYYEGI